MNGMIIIIFEECAVWPNGDLKEPAHWCVWFDSPLLSVVVCKSVIFTPSARAVRKRRWTSWITTSVIHPELHVTWKYMETHGNTSEDQAGPNISLGPDPAWCSFLSFLILFNLSSYPRYAAQIPGRSCSQLFWRTSNPIVTAFNSCRFSLDLGRPVWPSGRVAFSTCSRSSKGQALANSLFGSGRILSLLGLRL